MATTTTRKFFVNLAVSDLPATMAFWRKLGFSFNPQFTDDKAACLVISEDAFVMLLGQEYFKSFARKPLSDSRKQTEGLYGISASSRAEVDQLVKTALESGGSPAAPPQDHGMMYGSSFYDPDGHHWEVMWMDPAAIQQ